MVLAISLDVGTTQIKLAALATDGTMTVIAKTDSPTLRGEAGFRETDATSYLEKATALLYKANTPAGTPLGIATQRSSFLLWRRDNGRPVTPVISWQDTRAAAWCAARPDLNTLVWERTGLPLSPYYAAPKLAWLFEREPELGQQASTGELLFGTLESYLIWSWSEGRQHCRN